MASSSTMCASCLRAVRRSATSRSICNPRALRNPAASRSYSTASIAAQQPLYLDFLLPSSGKPSASARVQPINLLPRSSTPRRTFTSTSATSAEATPARAVIHPRNDDDGNPMIIQISPRASHRLATIAKTDSNPNLALRITVESGGCHGFQYLMNLIDLSSAPATEEDTVFEGEKGEKVVIDEPSLELLKGSTVDYTMELIGSQFKVTGIPGATSSCGCGTSFDIKF